MEFCTQLDGVNVLFLQNSVYLFVVIVLKECLGGGQKFMIHYSGRMENVVP